MTSFVRIKLSTPRSVGPLLRCVLCRDASQASPRMGCSCGIWLHVACARELVRSGCPTLGCAGAQLQAQLRPPTTVASTGCDRRTSREAQELENAIVLFVIFGIFSFIFVLILMNL